MKLSLKPAKHEDLSPELKSALTRAGSGIYSGAEDEMSIENKRKLDQLIFNKAKKEKLKVISNADFLARVDYTINNFCDLEFERGHFFRILLHSRLKTPMEEDQEYAHKIAEQKKDWGRQEAEAEKNGMTLFTPPEHRFVESVTIEDYISYLERIREVRRAIRAAGVKMDSTIVRYSDNPNFVEYHETGQFFYQSEYFLFQEPEEIAADIKALIHEIGWINDKYPRLKKFDPPESKEVVHTY